MTGTTSIDLLASVREFDRYLGDPRDAAALMRTDVAVRLDERSAFPADALAAIDAWGLQRHYVPAEHGGKLTDVTAPLLMIRHVARRDVTAAVGHGKTFLGSVCAWVAGGEIAARTAAIAVTGDPVSWGLTERGRGSDLSRSATVARGGGPTVRIDGGKWPIGNATRGRAMTILARTSDEPGPRSLSLLLVDKHDVDPSTLSYEPKVSTHGIRGADISGIRFTGTTVGGSAFVGPVGHGLEIVLKSLQLTRTLCTALSVGAADQALAIALDFATDHRVHGVRLADLPATRRALAEAVADLLLAEIVMFVGARTMHSAPAEMSPVSAFVKVLVPGTVDLLVRDLTDLLGLHSQFVGFAGAGAFQKAARDSRVVGIFDGNSVVNLNVIINEFPAMARPAPAPEISRVLDPLRPGAQAGALAPQALRLVSREGPQLLRALPELVETAPLSAPVRDAARRVLAEYETVVLEAAALPRESQPHPRTFQVAERAALVFGGACALAFGLARRDALPVPFAGDDAWLAAVLQRVVQRLGGPPIDPAVADAVTGSARGARAAGAAVTVLSDWAG
ncbi:acyl-CoA dehydrogenase family protein [Microbacterium sp. BWT-B31]|uniref:acyl-CoA dehydrogenase family protein n=1 Tax=Microbacterium sp. BWT-B31 TaxID=3232072 RepID=UPI00352735A8